MKKLLVLFLCLNFTILLGRSLDFFRYENYSFDGGIGILKDNHEHEGVNLGFGLNHFKKNNIFSLNYNYYEENPVPNDLSPYETHHSFELMYGKFYKIDHFRFNIQSGLGYLNGRERGKFLHDLDSFYSNKEIDISTICLPVKIGINVDMKLFTIGYHFKSNFSFNRIIYSTGFSLGFGKILPSVF